MVDTMIARPDLVCYCELVHFSRLVMDDYVALYARHTDLLSTSVDWLYFDGSRQQPEACQIVATRAIGQRVVSALRSSTSDRLSLPGNPYLQQAKKIRGPLSIKTV